MIFYFKQCGRGTAAQGAGVRILVLRVFQVSEAYNFLTGAFGKNTRITSISSLIMFKISINGAV